MKVLLVLVAAVSIIIFLLWNRSTPAKTLGESTKLKVSPIAEVISKSLKDIEGTYAVVFKNLKTGETYYLNDQIKFATGSLYKLWIMGEVYEQIEDGFIDKNETLSNGIDSLNTKHGSSETTGGTVTFALRDAIDEMITVSNNYASFLLTDRITLSSVSGFLVKYGFSKSVVGGKDLPTTTAFDIANFFEKLYKGQIVSPKVSLEMLEILKNQRLKQKIPKYLPSKAKIAHKTGEVDNFSHDAGIVYTNQGDYILVVMSETDLPGVANDRIAEISRAVYEYVTSQ